jgi:hypothetical protein
MCVCVSVRILVTLPLPLNLAMSRAMTFRHEPPWLLLTRELLIRVHQEPEFKSLRAKEGNARVAARTPYTSPQYPPGPVFLTTAVPFLNHFSIWAQGGGGAHTLCNRSCSNKTHTRTHTDKLAGVEMGDDWTPRSERIIQHYIIGSSV